VVYPDGWQTNNGFTAVTAITEQQDGLLQLGLGSKDPLQTQLTAFLQQQGVQAGATSRAPVNGLPAASAQFSAQLSQSAVQGYVNTYRLMGVSAPAKAATYDQAIRNWIASFRPLTDPARLGVKPMRIHLVRLAGPMRLSAFNTRYPSVVPIERVALINGVAEGGILPAGLAKQVVRQ